MISSANFDKILSDFLESADSFYEHPLALSVRQGLIKDAHLHLGSYAAGYIKALLIQELITLEESNILLNKCTSFLEEKIKREWGI